MKLTVLPGEYSVWRLAADAPLPSIEADEFVSMTRTANELSVVSSSDGVPGGVIVEGGWRCLQVEGPLPFDETGVLAEISKSLAEAEIPIFVVSTYETDYLLVKASDLERACSKLENEGHVFAPPKQVKG